MSGIVCAIRGGPFSRPTINKAIALSRESGQSVHFLYVVNLDFLTNALHSNVIVMEEEMRQMGEFILLNAQETARKAGVESQTVTRKGLVREEIIALCQETNASYVILGKPQHGQEHNVLASDALGDIAKEIEQECSAQVVFAEETDQ
jgi:nucleotide-binding universal stress UspA family protein